MKEIYNENIIIQEDNEGLNDKGDDYLCPKCNNSLMQEISDKKYQCDDIYCNGVAYEWDIKIIAR